ncbi:hypothetical protein NE237_000259 [Protea cynaroides]|uniref:Uncharacterized protein n=1 Tax=Protea cynaroides TaxID=273540 RepID=A0A9Q0KQT4_9MAGN|nr:hypothetical protein NE237_000259 [Protea cynaroides]
MSGKDRERGSQRRIASRNELQLRSLRNQNPLKRKRGRPRKDENLIRREPASATLPVIDTVRRNQHRRIDQTTDAMVGQVVSGVLEGSFDAGYLLTVKVGNTNTVLKGVVFEPGLSVPISVANDVAPHVKMFKRNEIPLPVVDLTTQVPCPNLQSKQNNERLVKVSRNEGVLPSKVSPHVNQVPKASQLSPSHRQTNTKAFSKGEINIDNHVPKIAPHVLQPEDTKAKSSPSIPAKGLVGEASGDASHAVQVSSQTEASQTKNRMPTDVLQNDKPGLPTRETGSLPVDASQVVRVSTQTSVPQIEKRTIASHTIQVSSQTEASQTKNKMPTDVLQNDKPDLPTREPGSLPVDANQVVQVSTQTSAPQMEKRTIGDASHAVQVSSQTEASQTKNRMPTDVLQNDKPGLFTREPGSLPVDASQVVQVSTRTSAPQIEKRTIDLLSNDKSDLPTSEPEGVPIDISGVVHVPSQVAASQTEARKSTNVWPNDNFDLPAKEQEGLPADANQVVEDSLQGAASLSGDMKLTNVLPDDKVDLLAKEHGSNQSSVIKLEQVLQPELKGDSSATQSLQLEHDRAVEQAEFLQENESALIRAPLNSTNEPEESKFSSHTEPSVEKLSGSEKIDLPTQVQQHKMISELGSGHHTDDTMKGSKIELNYIPVSDPPHLVTAQPDNEVTTLLENKASPKADTPQDLAFKLLDGISSRAEFSHLDGGPKADACESTGGHTKFEPQTSQLVDMLQRGNPAAQHDMVAVHVASESLLPEEVPQPELNNSDISMHNEDDSLQFQMFQRKPTPTADDMGTEHNEDSISNDAIPSKQPEVLQKETTPAVSLDLGAKPETQFVLPKAVPEHQIFKSTLPIQNEGNVSMDTTPSVQSQGDLVESMDIDSMDA